jgi:drug/metabolite transporter (DMT)-like permease
MQGTMRAVDAARLGALAAIWGGSFIFIRVVVPALGPVWTTEGRVLIGGLALAAWFAWTGFDARWRSHWRFYALIGVFNSALPFLLFSIAGLHLAAWLMAILNATTPMFGLALGALFAGERLTGSKTAGLALGAGGVALLAAPAEAGMGAGASAAELWAVAACLVASLSYAVGGVLVKRYGSAVPPRGVAVGAQLSAAVMLAPLLAFDPPLAAPAPLVLANLLAFGILASGVALILYFRLMADIGPTRALTVTFLIPLFAALWGIVFLGETPGAGAIAGGALVLAGTVLVTRG